MLCQYLFTVALAAGSCLATPVSSGPKSLHARSEDPHALSRKQADGGWIRSQEAADQCFSGQAEAILDDVVGLYIPIGTI